MQYRKFGKLDWKVSALGFGAMRLPQLDAVPSHVNEQEAIKMIRYAIDNGVNYVDTAYLYHQGASEVAVGKAIQDGYRQKMRLATKLPAVAIKSASDFDRILGEQLKRLQTDHIDFYLMHGLNNWLWPKIRDLNVIPWAEKQIKDGKLRYLGFSFHDEYEVFKTIIDAYDKWTFCQIQYNYLDINYQAGTRGLKYAAGKGLAVVVMEPLHGGVFTRTQPEPVARIWADAPQKRSPAEWGFYWVWDHPEVSLALSGMSTFEQVKENVALAARYCPGSLSKEEEELIHKVRSAYQELSPIPCTNCRYCMPCPQGVEIPHIFSLYNDAILYDRLPPSRFRYTQADLSDGQRADSCIECGECEEKCPQHIPNREWLKKVHALLNVK